MPDERAAPSPPLTIAADAFEQTHCDLLSSVLVVELAAALALQADRDVPHGRAVVQPCSPVDSEHCDEQHVVDDADLAVVLDRLVACRERVRQSELLTLVHATLTSSANAAHATARTARTPWRR